MDQYIHFNEVYSSSSSCMVCVCMSADSAEVAVKSSVLIFSSSKRENLTVWFLRNKKRYLTSLKASNLISIEDQLAG